MHRVYDITLKKFNHMWFSEYTLHRKFEEWKTAPTEPTLRNGDGTD
jgi:hypothetical protein